MLSPSFPPTRRRYHGNGTVPLREGDGVSLPIVALTAEKREALAAAIAPRSRTGAEAEPKQGARQETRLCGQQSGDGEERW